MGVAGVRGRAGVRTHCDISSLSGFVPFAPPLVGLVGREGWAGKKQEGREEDLDESHFCDTDS